MNRVKVWLAACAATFLLPFGANAVEADYTLNSGDVLQVTVWKEDGLDREVSGASRRFHQLSLGRHDIGARKNRHPGSG